VPWWLTLALQLGALAGVLGLGMLWWETRAAIREIRDLIDRSEDGKNPQSAGTLWRKGL
jgi:hypothetical protein